MARRTPPVDFEFLDHTADIGVVIHGRDASDLFATAGVVLGELIYEPAQVDEVRTRSVALDAASLEELMVRWLNELLYLFEVERLAWKGVEVEVSRDNRLSAILHGEEYQAGKHTLKTGLKAATYHQLEIQSEPGRHRAQIVFDV